MPTPARASYRSLGGSSAPPSGVASDIPFFRPARMSSLPMAERHRPARSDIFTWARSKRPTAPHPLRIPANRGPWRRSPSHQPATALDSPTTACSNSRIEATMKYACSDTAFVWPRSRRHCEGHPSILGAAVQLREFAPGEPRLVGYLVRKQGARYTETDLRRHLRSLLPEVMVPHAFVELEAIPLSRSGRPDPEQLPSPFGTPGREHFVAPRTPMERLVAELWEEELGPVRIGLHDNFFDLGGHSLLCFKFIAALERRVGKRLSPRVVLLNSLEQVAAQVDADPAFAESAPPATGQAAPPALAGRVWSKLRELVRGSS